MLNKVITLFLLVLCATLATAQQAMNNDSVLKLVKAGLSEDLIVSTINAAPGAYDISADALVALKAAGAGDKTISAIVARASGATTAPGSVQVQANSQAPSVEEPEVMAKVFFLNSETHKLQQLPGEEWTRKVKPGFSAVKSEDIVEGEHSSVRISSKEKIVFIIRPFPDQQNFNLIQGIRLYPFEVKHDQRVCVVQTQKGGWGGPTHQGNPNVVPLQAVKYGYSSFALSPPDSHLPPGEYWIHVPGAAGYSDPLITFGVD